MAGVQTEAEILKDSMEKALSKMLYPNEDDGSSRFDSFLAFEDAKELYIGPLNKLHSSNCVSTMYSIFLLGFTIQDVLLHNVIRRYYVEDSIIESIVEFLLNVGVDPNGLDHLNNKPLDLCMSQNCRDMIIAAGGSPSQR
jgi:hypothetical protein